MGDRIEVHAAPDIIGRGHVVYIVQGDAAFTLTPVNFTPGTSIDPSISGADATEFLQAAMDCAWASGIRPIGFSDTAEQVRAMGRHLEDMRTIAFAKLDVEKPNG